MGYAVVSHEHDEVAGLYRLVVGIERREDVAAASPEGDELLGPDGNPLAVSSLIGYDNVHDYVFVDSDDRWFVDGARVSLATARAAQVQEVDDAGVISIVELR